MSAKGTAKSGTVKVKLSYDDWKEANVQPLTAEFPIPPTDKK